MQPLLASGEVERIARADALLAFDFDGTLAPIVDEPQLAQHRCTRAGEEAVAIEPQVRIQTIPQLDDGPGHGRGNGAGAGRVLVAGTHISAVPGGGRAR